MPKQHDRIASALRGSVEYWQARALLAEAEVDRLREAMREALAEELESYGGLSV